MTDPGLGAPMIEVLSRLQTVGAFFNSSTWSKRVDDPTISDFVAGNPHDMPVPGITEAIQKWAVPQTRDWYAYKPDVPAAREAAAKTLSEERGVTYAKEDVFLTPGTFGALSVTTTVVNPACSSVAILAAKGVRALASRMIRRSGLLAFRAPRSGLRARMIRPGSSASTVLMPTRIASAPRRNFIP